MPQTITPDPERGSEPGGPEDHRDDPTTTPNQPFQGESNFGDSSGRLFSMYSKAADEEDNKMVERWQKDADGILIFTGLFSAAVAALLAVTVQGLSRDISAYYLGNIYQVLADPNVTRSSTPTSLAQPPSFSPSRSAVWVNTLWFLSLVMSLSCALLATSLHQWARRYLRLAQPARCSPERRARMRAFFAGGVDKMHIPWAVEGLPMLLHLSLFLFFGGLAVFLFDINREVFHYVICWIGLFLIVYGMITVLPLIRHDSPYNSPLSGPAWFLHATVVYITVQTLRFIIFFCAVLLVLCFFCNSRILRTMERVIDPIYKRISDSARDCGRWMLGGVEKAAEETASKRSSDIDLQILDWTISTLGDDESLKNFFEAIPDFFKSKLVDNQRRFPGELVEKFAGALGGYLVRTWSLNSVDDSEKTHRLGISLNVINQIGQTHDRFIIHRILFQLRHEVSQTVDMGLTIARWFTNNDQDIPAEVQRIIAKILLTMRRQNDSWVTLAAQLYCLPEPVIALRGDNLSLATLMYVSRQYLRSGYFRREVLVALSELDICNTQPSLQNDFCTLWNELVQEAWNEGAFCDAVDILQEIRHLYIELHQGTDAAPTAFTSSTARFDIILDQPSSYPFCYLASHCPCQTAHFPLPLPTQSSNSSHASSHSPIDGDNTASRQARRVNNTIEQPSSSDPTTTGQIRATPHGSDIVLPTNPVYSSSRPTTGPSLTVVVAAAQQDIPSTSTLSRPLRGSEQKDSDIVITGAERGTTASIPAITPTVPPIPTSLPNAPLESYDDAGVAAVSNFPHVVPPSLRSRSSIPASRPTGSPTLPRLRPRGLVNTKNICFANAVLQLLVNSAPFWNLFKKLENLKEQRGAEVSETGGSATPLVGATMRFLKEFLVEESSSTQQRSQPDTDARSRVGEDDNVVDSFEPTYMYDAMKSKTQLKRLLDGKHQDAGEFLCLYLDALDEELVVLLASLGGRQSASAVFEREEREASHSDQTEVGSQDNLANLTQSPIAHIFGGKFRLPIPEPNRPDPASTEDWRSLHLDIQYDSIRTVQDALAQISQPQFGVQVPGASGLGNASRQVLIEKLPPVLVLHLNRFQYDAAEGVTTKIKKFIQLTSELEIPLDIMVPTAQRLSDSEPPHYKLHGVLYHHGDSTGSGHYSVDVLRPNGGCDAAEVWLHIDDETVTQMRHEDMFGGQGTERAAHEQCAYILFYCRAS